MCSCLNQQIQKPASPATYSAKTIQTPVHEMEKQTPQFFFKLWGNILPICLCDCSLYNSPQGLVACRIDVDKTWEENKTFVLLYVAHCTDTTLAHPQQRATDAHGTGWRSPTLWGIAGVLTWQHSSKKLFALTLPTSQTHNHLQQSSWALRGTFNFNQTDDVCITQTFAI